jgi:hypothetical protein
MSNHLYEADIKDCLVNCISWKISVHSSSTALANLGVFNDGLYPLTANVVQPIISSTMPFKSTETSLQGLTLNQKIHRGMETLLRWFAFGRFSEVYIMNRMVRFS